jgi:hypothetical protein
MTAIFFLYTQRSSSLPCSFVNTFKSLADVILVINIYYFCNEKQTPKQLDWLWSTVIVSHEGPILLIQLCEPPLETTCMQHIFKGLSQVNPGPWSKADLSTHPLGLCHMCMTSQCTGQRPSNTEKKYQYVFCKCNLGLHKLPYWEYLRKVLTLHHSP